MIDYLKHMAVFARVVDEGSFRAAAKGIGLAPSRISQTVSDLETHLGVTLLYRTTRKIALTNEGRILYEKTSEMLKIAESGLNELNALSQEPSGSLRISLPAFMATSSLSTAFAKFSQQYPLVSLIISYSDQPIDILQSGCDLNIRAGWLDNSSMMSRKLGEHERILVASASFMAQKPPVSHPSEISQWDWIGYQQRGDHITFTSDANEEAKIQTQYKIQVDNIDALYHFINQHIGLSIIPRHMAASGLASGDLKHVLPQWKLRSLGCYALWPDQSRRENLTLLLVRFLAEHEKTPNT